MNIQEQIGKRMRMIRSYSEIKQKDIAEKMDIPASLLSLYEKGKREPSIKHLKMFCDELNIPLSQFFFDIEGVSKPIKNPDLNKIKNELIDIFNDLEKNVLKQNK